MDAPAGRAFATCTVAVLSAALVACGSGGKSTPQVSSEAGGGQPYTASTVTQATTGGPSAAGPGAASEEKSATGGPQPATATTPRPATTGPGVGRPAVTIGDESSAEQSVLGALYAQALAAKGYEVTLRDDVGGSEAGYEALTSGRIDMFPEYIGTLLSVIAKQTATPASASATYLRAKAFVKKQGLTLLNYTPFYDSDALAVRPRYAGEHGLSSIADLQRMGKSVTLGASSEFATRPEGLRGLEREYGVNPTFRPIAPGLSFKALEAGQVDVQNVSTSSGQLVSGKFELLADPKHVFGFQNASPLVRQSILTAEGPAFAQTVNKVSSLLTIGAMQEMNAAIGLDRQPASSVARHFLAVNGLS
jgi:osmoprotectant transport system substrate-binding protein